MKKQYILPVFLLLIFIVQAQDSQPFITGGDPFSANENIISSPETASLGQFGELSASPYNGTANVNVPIYNLEWEGMSIPISLSYSSSGVQVASEASWVGLNWSSSTTFGIHRKIYGQDDFNDRAAGIYQGAPKSGYIYNPLTLELEEGAPQPYLSLDDILNVHHSFAIRTAEGRQKVFMDTQPDVYTVNVFGASYTFIFNKKASNSDILTTQVFNNNNAVITYDLNDHTFTLIDENGFTYTFNTKEINTTFDSVQSDGGSPPGDYISAIRSIFATHNRDNAGLVTFWHLDQVTSPKGRTLNFTYQKGLNFTFPSYNISERIDDHQILNRNDEQYMGLGGGGKTHSVSTVVIENNYLTRIDGDFGRIRFNLSEREDLATGHTIDELSDDALVLVITGTGEFVRDCHGLNTTCGTSTALKPWKLESVEVEDFIGNTILNAALEYSYFDSHKLGTVAAERYLRLKLDQVTVNDQIYTFDYLDFDLLPAKDTFAVDFWGFYNGEDQNTHQVPSLGRFITTVINLQAGGVSSLAQSFFTYDGANRSSNFNYGKRGTLNRFTYPTGASLHLEYEPHDVVLEAPAPFEEVSNFLDYTNYTGPSRIEWTNMIDESLFNPTYQYLKYAKDPTYNYFEKELPTIQGDPVVIPLGINQSFVVDFTSVINIEGHLQTHCNWEGLEYWGNFPTVVLVNLDTGNEVTLFTYSDAPNEFGNTQAVNHVSASRTVLPGEYVVSRRLGVLPPGEDYNDYPGAPHVEYHSDDIQLFTFETLTDEDLAQFLERFEIGGLRVKSLTNRSRNGDFLSSKEYKYEYSDGLPGLLSSGRLMDDLIFYSKASGFHSYNPRGYADFVYTGSNMLGGNNSAQGSHIGYSNVQEFQVNALGEPLGMIETEFHNQKNEYFTDTFDLPYAYNSLIGDGDPYINVLGINLQWFCSGLTFGNDCAGTTRFTSTYGYSEIKNTVLLGLPLRLNYSYINGSVLEQRVFNSASDLVEKTENTYISLNGNVSLDHYASFMNIPMAAVEAGPNSGEAAGNWLSSWEEGVWGANHHTYYPYSFPIHHGLVAKVANSTKTTFLENDYVLNEAFTIYDPSTHFTKEQQVILDEVDQISNKLYYPTDTEVYNHPNINRLRDENRLSTLVKREEFRNQDKTLTQLFGFDNSADTQNTTLIHSIASAKGNDALETRYYIDKYDEYGNIIQKHHNNGMTTSYLWTYFSLYPSAVVQNATHQQILDTGVNLNIVNSQVSSIEEKNTELQKIRDGLPTSLVTTYTYDPLIGITSETDPRGYTMYYIYDDHNRLKYVKDQNGKVYSKNEYEYRINH
ncbi:hypothetical protein [Spongiimicrobium salis]|uniref:hypothetical protein n=1 Tax=Spongiimicrobium salis TaxID=1667022 RepID=UPI00374DB0BC